MSEAIRNDVPEAELDQCRRCGVGIIHARDYRAHPEFRPGHRRHGARGLCKTCYSHERYYGRLGDWPSATWRRGDLLEEWVWLREAGTSDLVMAAGRIGVSPRALDRALHRALTDGDDRGRHPSCRGLR